MGMRWLGATASLLLIWPLAQGWTQETAGARAGKEEIRACQQCHGNPNLTGFDIRGQRHSVWVEEEAFYGSVHGGLRCTQCHQDIDPTQLPHPRHARRVDCAGCHQEQRLPQAPQFEEGIFQSYADSVHGGAVARGDLDAPDCADCHGHHDILPKDNPRAHVNRQNIPQTCSRCHSDARLVAWHRIPKGATLIYYERSVHGQRLREGKVGGEAAPGKSPAVCTDCHGVHGIRAARDPESQVARPHLPTTCGHCHQSIFQRWRQSIHGKAWAEGVKEAPTCTGCHGEHTIQSPDDPTAPTYHVNEPATCGRCHSNARLMQRQGITGEVVATYAESFHGKKHALGSQQAPVCSSCHGHHEISDPQDPASPLHPNRRAQTCGRCHQVLGAKFALTFSHQAPSRQIRPAIYWLDRVFVAFVFSICAGMVLYVLLDLPKSVRQLIHRFFPEPETPVAPRAPEQHYLRWNLHLRLQHLIMMSSVLLLMLTGLPLLGSTYPFARVVMSLLGGSDRAAILHRIAGVGMGLAIIYHFSYLLVLFLKGYRHTAMLPTSKDFVDLAHEVGHLLGRRPQPARMGRYNFVEKFLYFGAGWGIILMGLSGLILWQAAWFAEHTWPVMIEIAAILHSHEALLASVALLVFHLYFAHLRYDVFPMSKVWLTGRIGEHELRERHILELEAMQRENEEADGEVNQGTPSDTAVINDER